MTSFADHQRSSPNSPPVVRWSVGPFLELALTGSRLAERKHVNAASKGSKTMALLIEGRFTGKAVRGEVGRRSPNAPVTVNIDVEIGEGEHKGKRFQYVGKCGPDNIKYTKWAAKAVGWKGKDIVQTLDRDIKAANLTVEFDLKIARFERDGQVQEWTAVDRIHGIREAIPVAADEAGQVNSWFDEPDGGTSHSTYPPPPATGNRHPNAPGNDDDLPF